MALMSAPLILSGLATSDNKPVKDYKIIFSTFTQLVKTLLLVPWCKAPSSLSGIMGALNTSVYTQVFYQAAE